MSTGLVDSLARVAVVGTSGCGKTTFARRLAELLDAPHIELDALYWGPNWQHVPPEQFREAVAAATSGPRWICDGNYQPVRDLVWGQATALVWLNYSFPVVFSRALRRSIVRCVDGRPLFGDNYETFRLTFLSRQSILLWVVQTYWQRRREYPRLLGSPEFTHLGKYDFANPREARRWLDKLAAEV